MDYEKTKNLPDVYLTNAGSYFHARKLVDTPASRANAEAEADSGGGSATACYSSGLSSMKQSEYDRVCELSECPALQYIELQNNYATSRQAHMRAVTAESLKKGKSCSGAKKAERWAYRIRPLQVFKAISKLIGSGSALIKKTPATRRMAYLFSIARLRKSSKNFHLQLVSGQRTARISEKDRPVLVRTSPCMLVSMKDQPERASGLCSSLVLLIKINTIVTAPVCSSKGLLAASDGSKIGLTGLGTQYFPPLSDRPYPSPNNH